MRESRLIGLTLEEVNKQRVAAGATATNTVYNSRTAEANYARQVQPVINTGTSITDPAAASLQRLRETQAYFTANPSALADANKSAAYTGATDVQSQALAGQKVAESYVAPTKPGNAEYYKQQAAQLQGANSTYTNAANGFQSQVNNSIDTNKDSPTYGLQLQGPVQMASQSGLEQAAIDNLRKNGKTDAEITSIMASPEFKNSIMTAMSNTGTGTGTARTSPVLTTAEAQNILATSRNPQQRKDAQSFIDSQVGGVKGYAPRTTTNDQGTFTTYSEDAGATAQAQQKERERLALEQANRLKSQEAADKLKKFVAGVDTTAIDKTKTQIDTLMSSIAGLSPDLQAAVLPQLLAIQQTNNDIASQANEIRDALPTDKEIEGSYGTMESYILSQDAKFKEILSRNLETSKEIAQYNQDALKIEKQIIDHDAAVSEQKQIVANAEGEKMLRRQLNRLDIQTDTSGLSYLQSEIQKGITALDNLKTANNLVSLKAQLAIGEGYRLEVKQAMENYEANYLNLTSQTTEKLQTIKNSINTAKADRNKSIIETKKWELQEKIKLDGEARTMISGAFKDMMTQQKALVIENRQKEESALNKIEYLLKNYPRESVADAIKELGKDVTSFDVSVLASNPTLAELEKAKKAVKTGMGRGFSDYLPSGMREKPKPQIQFSEYADEKIREMEQTESQSFTTQKRAELLLGNNDKWQEEYDALYVSGMRSDATANATEELTQQFGDKVVQAAQLVMDGTYTGTDPIGKAAETMGVSSAQVATALTKLRQSGAISDTATLSSGQQKGWDTLRKELEGDDFYKVWKGSKSAVSRIQTAITTGGGDDGINDIMAINAFQNGIVDPGSTVKEGDVALLQTAIAWATKWNITSPEGRQYWAEKINSGAKMPEAMRTKMLELAQATEKAYYGDFQATTIPRFKSEVKLKGLPQSVLDSYLGIGSVAQPTTVSSEVKTFADTYFSQ